MCNTTPGKRLSSQTDTEYYFNQQIREITEVHKVVVNKRNYRKPLKLLSGVCYFQIFSF